MATRDEIADFLEDAGVGTVGTSLYKGQMPATPNVCGAVLDAGGLRPEYVMGSTGTISTERPKLQIRFRGEPGDYATPRGRAETAYRALAAVANQTINSTRYLSITPVQPPFTLNRDQNNRFEVGFNVEIEKALS